MKHIIILGDGMADEPIAELGNKTPLQAAKTPYIDTLTMRGNSGLLNTIPRGYHPGSEIANLSVLGYDIPTVFEGRGILEAASMGVEIAPDEMAMRCNLICIENGNIKNHSAGHISTEEARVLIDFLNEHLADDAAQFFAGVSYRHLLKMKHGDKAIRCTPPHDVPGVPFRDVIIQPESPASQATTDALNRLILSSQTLLKDHPINRKRIAKGKDPANSVWFWSPGYRPKMEVLSELYGIGKGVVISAVDLIRGIGVYAGLQPIDVQGATGLYDTNYEGKAQAAIDALRDNDFVYLHIEASDEAGHEGDVELKIKTIEYLDRRIVKPIYEAAQQMSEPVSIAVLPDHPTPCALRTHTAKPVPFVIFNPEMSPDNVTRYDEFAVLDGSFGTLYGNQFMKTLLRNRNFIPSTP